MIRCPSLRVVAILRTVVLVDLAETDSSRQPSVYFKVLPAAANSVFTR
jgi:hypothetical protein